MEPIWKMIPLSLHSIENSKENQRPNLHNGVTPQGKPIQTNQNSQLPPSLLTCHNGVPSDIYVKPFVYIALAELH